MIQLKHNYNIDLATAHSRLSKKWQNKPWAWEAFVNHCAQTRRTEETAAEYARKSREEQSQIKDVGGFVGGYVRNGIRKTENVIYRTLVTLDIDHYTPDQDGTPPPYVWEVFKSKYNSAAVLYSTHKHADDTPRYRLIIPLSRQVTPSEYEPICRRIAESLGIEQFDTSTYQLARLFYWPSTSKDAPFVFEYLDAPALNPDSVLATYIDHQDASLWPISSREGEAVAHEIKRAGDPTEKRGLIGAFCRTYTIEEAIAKYLADKYTETSTQGRYTYTQGSVAAGLVCYDGKFAYSHHESDPAGGKLCNAFDLVRLHLYGAQDEGARVQDTTKLPSYQAMQELAAKDKAVRVLLTTERQEEVKNDFAGLDDTQSTDQEDNTWMELLEYDKRAAIKPTTRNIRIIIENDPALKDKVQRDLFGGFDLLKGKLPWPTHAKEWQNVDFANLRVYLEETYQITGKERINDALDAALTKTATHPVREYLNSLTWDGTPRLDKLVIDYIGAEDTPLNRAMTRKHFTAAVARVMQPGCKYDHCLILTGAEGVGKSTLFHTMGGAWFNDSVITTEGKQGMEQLRGAWIIELAELSSIKRSEVEQVKGYITRREDIYRPAYGIKREVYPRQCVFCGTTNERYFLKGDTGNRRFWVIPVDEQLRTKALKAIAEDRDQLWAEATHYYHQGEPLYLNMALEAEAKERQQEYNDDYDDPIKELLFNFLDTKLPIDWDTYDLHSRRMFLRHPDPLTPIGTETRKRVSVVEFICERLGKDIDGEGYKYLARKVGKILDDLEGWERIVGSRHAQRLYGRQRAWERSNEDEEEDHL